MLNENYITLAGEVTFFRFFEPNGKEYTSCWIKINTQYSTVLAEVSVSKKDLQGKVLPAMRKILEGDGKKYALLVGQIVNKKDKDKEVTRVKVSSLSSLQVYSEEISNMNLAVIGGDVEKLNNKLLVVGVNYRDVKENQWKKRKVPVVLPAPGTEEFNLLHRNALDRLTRAKNVVIVGKVSSKLPNGEELINIVPSMITT